MYQKPDFVQVSVKVEDVFANYLATGCPEDEQGSWMHTVPCEGTPEYEYEKSTFTEAGWGHQCYSVLNP